MIKKKTIIENLKTLFYALIIAIIIRSLFLQPFYIPSSSMEPTLLVGDRLFVTKYSYGYSKHSFPFSPPILNSKKKLNKLSFFSNRFAAKESFVKALGTGFRENLNFKDVEIINDKLGKPYYSISKKINQLIKRKKKVKNFELFLSISDEKDYSVAFTIIQKKL